MSGVNRRPFAGELIDFPTPDPDPDKAGTIFKIKRCGVKENVARQNLASTMRYVEKDDTGTVVTERDYPIGSLNMATLQYGLADWNILDDNNAVIPCTPENMQTYLSPIEFSGILEKIIEVNPMWGRGGEAAAKKS